MGIQRSKDGFNRSYKCDICGTESVQWGETWSCYSSIAMEELRPDLIPVLCSPGCRDTFKGRIKAGAIEVPRVSPVGYTGVRVTGERRGY